PPRALVVMARLIRSRPWNPAKRAASDTERILTRQLPRMKAAAISSEKPRTRSSFKKVVGEILAGVVLGPALIGGMPFASRLVEVIQQQGNILNFVYWLGLLLLMFLSGAETRQLFSREERRTVAWLAIVGTGIPFILALVLV